MRFRRNFPLHSEGFHTQYSRDFPIPKLRLSQGAELDKRRLSSGISQERVVFVLSKKIPESWQQHLVGASARIQPDF